MNIGDRVQNLGKRYAFAFMKRHPGIILLEIRNQFTHEIRDVNVVDLQKSAETKTDLLSVMPEEYKKTLRKLLATKEARDLYRKGVRPHITQTLLFMWLKEIRPDIWGYLVLCPDEVRKYIVGQFARGIEEADKVCAELENVNTIAPNTYIVKRVKRNAQSNG